MSVPLVSHPESLAFHARNVTVAAKDSGPNYKYNILHLGPYNKELILG